jgi:hypothetical protein
VRTERQTDRYDEANILLSQFCKKPLQMHKAFRLLLLLLLLLLGVRGKLRMYCSLLAYCTARFGRSNFSLLDAPAPTDAFRTLAGEVGTMSGNRLILPRCRLPRYIKGSFTCRKSATWDPRLYFPSEGRRA